MEKLRNMYNILCDGEGGVIEIEYFNHAADRLEELENENEFLKNGRVNLMKECVNLRKQLSEKQPEWISVEDRLPEENGTYLIAIKDSFCPHFTGFDAEANEFCENVFRKSDVTHWMPLPEPPKPKEPSFKDVFLEKFPKAIMYNDGIPLSCRASIFGGKCSLGSTKCFECWNQPYFETEEEGEADGK